MAKTIKWEKDFDREKFNKAIPMLEEVLKDHPKSDAAPEAVYL